MVKMPAPRKIFEGESIPESGNSVCGGEALTSTPVVAVTEGLEVGKLVGETGAVVGLLISPEGVAVKEGRSLSPVAKTVKLLLIFLTIPLSTYEIVMRCSPGVSGVWGDHFQSP